MMSDITPMMNRLIAIGIQYPKTGINIWCIPSLQMNNPAGRKQIIIPAMDGFAAKWKAS